jgi:diguanylate cyclase (GGDEF)-like protein
MNLEAITDPARLAALEDLEILDTGPEPVFDRLTRLVSDMLSVPISLLSLIDRDRQFFKSACGLSAPWAEATQIPLSHSFCQHAVAAKRRLVIDDARQNPLVAGNLATRDLSVIAYAGVPLVLQDGHCVGVFCAIDRQPRRWSELDLRLLEDLAGTVNTLLDQRRSLAQQRLQDPVTGLPSPAMTMAYSDALTGAHDGHKVLAIAVGVNDFESIIQAHDKHHDKQRADHVLKLVGQRIAHQLSGEDILGRLEHDVFTVLRPRVVDQREALELAARIREGVSAEPLKVRGEALAVSVSVGTAIGEGGRDVVTQALEAMRNATPAEGGRIGEPEHRTLRPAPWMDLRGALRGAVARGEITVVFQPIVELATRRLTGFEALARFTHPEFGAVAPSRFIPVAEASGEIMLIGEHVLRTACRRLAGWREQSGEDLRVTVNLSPVQLAVANIAEVIEGILGEYELPGRALVLDITESVFTTPVAVERRSLERMREMGIQIALDNFGTGHSTLSDLRRFPVDVIKVDRSLLDGLETDHRDAPLMQAILAIGVGMDIELVAEGVETRAQRELLCLSGCHYGQGYLFAAPMPADEIQLAVG